MAGSRRHRLSRPSRQPETCALRRGSRRRGSPRQVRRCANRTGVFHAPHKTTPTSGQVGKNSAGWRRLGSCRHSGRRTRLRSPSDRHPTFAFSRSARRCAADAGAASSVRSCAHARACTPPPCSAGPRPPAAPPPGASPRRTRTTRSTCARAGCPCAYRSAHPSSRGLFWIGAEVLVFFRSETPRRRVGLEGPPASYHARRHERKTFHRFVSYSGPPPGR